jgi:hypothetical protein
MIYLFIALLTYFLIYFWMTGCFTLVSAGKAAGKWDFNWNIRLQDIWIAFPLIRLSFAGAACLTYFIYTLT